MGSSEGAKKARDKTLADKFNGDTEAYGQWVKEIAKKGGDATAKRWEQLKKLENKEKKDAK